MCAVLTTNDELTWPGTCIFVDTESRWETDQLNPRRQLHSFRLASATACRIESGKQTRRKSERFREARDFWSWVNFVRHPRMPVWIFAHNLGFDLTMLDFWGQLTAGNFSLHQRPLANLEHIRSEKLKRIMSRTKKGFLMTDDPPSAVECYHRDRWKCILIDSLNYFDRSLEQIADWLGLEKLPLPANDATWDDWFARCDQDVKILEAALLKWLLWHGKQELGRFSFTLAGACLAGFRHRWMAHEIDLPDDQSQRDFEREAFYLGRTQALWLGEISPTVCKPVCSIDQGADLFTQPPRGPFFQLDANSFYGAIGAYENVPVKTIETSANYPGIELEPSQLDETCLAHVLIETREETFPVRTPEGIAWPIGTYWTTLCGTELLRALTAGLVKRVGRWCRYEMAPAFRKYACDLWTERLSARAAGDGLLEHVCKQMLARLHGKFAQRLDEWVDDPAALVDTPWSTWMRFDQETHQVRQYRSIGWDAQYRRPKGDARHAFPAIAAFTTAAGRERLLALWRVAGPRDVVYLSTDSLIVTQAGLERLADQGMIDPDELGYLRIVAEDDHIHIRGPNNYSLGKRHVIAGRHRSHKIIAADRYQATHFQSLLETIHLKGPNTVAVSEIVKTVPLPATLMLTDRAGWLRPPVMEGTP